MGFAHNKNTQGNILAVCHFGLTRYEEKEIHNIPKYGLYFVFV